MKSLLAAVSIALCASGCAVLDSTATFDPYTLYLKNFTRVRARTELLDRYACASGAPLMCQCMSRLSPDCECQC